MSSSRLRLARCLVVAYTLVIVYASLQPFAGWRIPPEAVRAFLTAPWPRYVTAGDLMLNVAAYLPLGTMLFLALRTPLPPIVAFSAATLIGTLVSLAMESAQMFLPMRIASNVDLLSNSLGAGIGALAAWLLTLPAFADNPVTALRRRWIRVDTFGDVGLVVVGLWLLTQFSPGPLALGNGDLREALRLTEFFPHSAPSYLLAEAGVAALAIMAIGLLISLLVQPRHSALPAILVTLALALSVKSIADAVLTPAAHWLQWLTPGVATGLLAGMVVLSLLLRLGHIGRAASAFCCIVAVVFVVNLAPENPYQSVPAFMLSALPTHLVNFSHIVHTLSQAWPLIFAIFVLVAAVKPYDAATERRAGVRSNEKVPTAIRYNRASQPRTQGRHR